MREIRPSGSMSGEWKRGLDYRATPRLYFMGGRFEKHFSSYRGQFIIFEVFE